MNTGIIIAITILFILNMCDVGLTNYAVKNLGVQERNPLMRFIVHRTGLIGMVTMKCILMCLILITGYYSEWQMIEFVIMIYIMAVVCGWNYGVIKGIKQKNLVLFSILGFVKLDSLTESTE